MKISFWVPKTENIQTIIKFLNKEIAQARNIKSKKTRENTLIGLNSVKNNLIESGTGNCFYADAEYSGIIKYEGNTKMYHCGTSFIEPEPESKFI